MVRRRQVTAEGDAENFECKVTGDATQQRRWLDAVTSTAVIEDDFLRLARIQRQIIILGRPRRYVGGPVRGRVHGRRRPRRRAMCRLQTWRTGCRRVEAWGRQLAVTAYVAGPRLEPCTILADIDIVEDSPPLYTVRCVCPSKNDTYSDLSTKLAYITQDL